MNELLQDIFNNFTLENILSKWDALPQEDQASVLERCIELKDGSTLQYLFEEKGADPNYFLWGTLSGLALEREEYECLEVIFKAGGRFDDDQVLSFDEKEKKYYFKLMFENKASLTAEEIAKFYELRWEMLTRNEKVYREKWEGLIIENKISDLKSCIEATPDLFRTETGIFCLYKSIELNKPEILELLLENKVDPNIFLINTSPLQLAFSKSHFECAEILLKHGACLTWEEVGGETIITTESKEANINDNEEIKKEVAEKNDQSLNDFLINDFNRADYGKACMLQRFIKSNELKAANILISKNIYLDEEQIEGLDDAQKLIYNELLNNNAEFNDNDAGLIGEFNVLDIDQA